MNITEYCRKVALMSKLRAALENIEVGQGYTVFEGLQDGPIAIKLVVDDETAHFEREKAGVIEEKPVSHIDPTAFPDLPTLVSAGDLFCDKCGASYGSMTGGPDQKCPICNPPETEKTHKSRKREQP